LSFATETSASSGEEPARMANGSGKVGSTIEVRGRSVGTMRQRDRTQRSSNRNGLYGTLTTYSGGTRGHVSGCRVTATCGTTRVLMEHLTRNAFLIRACHVFTLCSFAFAQPLFDLIAREPAFLVVHRAGLIDVLAVAVVLCLLLPAVFVGLEVAVRAVSANGEKWTHYGTVALLAALVALPALKGTGWPGILLLGLSSGIGIAVAASYASFPAARLFLTFLSPAILLVPAIFVFRPATAPVLFPRTPVAAHGSTGAHAQIQPVVIVVFDEFPLTSLLDERFQIDAVRYPHFADLARNATWFRSAMTVDDRTVVAVPTIFSGTTSPTDALPIYEHYPRNIFTLLQNTHQLHVLESLTKLCPEALCPEASQRSRGRRLVGIVHDLSNVYLHVVLPQEYTNDLPPVTQTWKDFDGGTLLKKASRSFDDRAVAFSSFVASIEVTAKPGLHVIHTLLPHVPWEYFPSGVVYTLRHERPRPFL
jgi:hypothetical protein